MIEFKDCKNLKLDDSLIRRLGIDIRVENCDGIYMTTGTDGNKSVECIDVVDQDNPERECCNQKNKEIDFIETKDPIAVGQELHIRDILKEMCPSVSPVMIAKITISALRRLDHYRAIEKNKSTVTQNIDPEAFEAAPNGIQKIKLILESIYPELEEDLITVIVNEEIIRTLNNVDDDCLKDPVPPIPIATKKKPIYFATTKRHQRNLQKDVLVNSIVPDFSRIINASGIQHDRADQLIKLVLNKLFDILDIQTIGCAHPPIETSNNALEMIETTRSASYLDEVTDKIRALYPIHFIPCIDVKDVLIKFVNLFKTIAYTYRVFESVEEMFKEMTESCVTQESDAIVRKMFPDVSHDVLFAKLNCLRTNLYNKNKITPVKQGTVEVGQHYYEDLTDMGCLVEMFKTLYPSLPTKTIKAEVFDLIKNIKAEIDQ